MSDTHSHPARVDKAYWNGAVAASMAGPNCCAIVLAVNLLITSPTTIPPQFDDLVDRPGEVALGKLLGNKKELVHVPWVAE